MTKQNIEFSEPTDFYKDVINEILSQNRMILEGLCNPIMIMKEEHDNDQIG